MLTFQEVKQNIILEANTHYFDFTASGLAYKPIEEALQDILKKYANIHSQIGSNAQFMTDLYERSREQIKKNLDISSDFFIIPAGTGATGAIKKFQELVGIYIPPQTKKRVSFDKSTTPVVFIGPFEHHSNEISFREGLCDVVRIGLDEKGNIDLKQLENELSKVEGNREIIGSFSVASNVTGIINPIQKISDILRKHNAIVCFDAATSSAYMNIPSNLYDVMFLSPHKLLGGPGSCGILVIKKELCNIGDRPTFAGGGTVQYVSRNSHVFLEDIEKIEDAGTPGILQFIKAAMAYDLRSKIGLEQIKQKENDLLQIAKERFCKIDKLKLYCKHQTEKLPIFSFNIDGKSPYAITKELSDRYGVQTRAGCSCAGPYGHDILELEDGIKMDDTIGWVRASFHYTHSYDDIDYFFNSLQKVV